MAGSSRDSASRLLDRSCREAAVSLDGGLRRLCCVWRREHHGLNMAVAGSSVSSRWTGASAHQWYTGSQSSLTGTEANVCLVACGLPAARACNQRCMVHGMNND